MAPPVPDQVLPFLEHLRPRHPDAAEIAEKLVRAGWEVVELWGPVQMDVWRLTLRHGEVRVSMGIERGLADEPVIWKGEPDSESRATPTMLCVATFAWSRLNGVPFAFSPLEFSRLRQAPHAHEVLDWYATDERVVERVSSAFREHWREYWELRHPRQPAAMRDLEDRARAAMTAAVDG